MLRSVPRTVDAPATLPYGSAVGYLAYELGRFTEPGRDGRPPAPDGPLAVLSRYDPVLAYDRSRAQYTLVCAGPAGARVPWLERLAAPAPAWGGPLATAPLAPLLPRERYLAAVRRILDYLAAGDVYQVNLTQPYAAPLAAPAWALFAALARRHPVPHGAYLDVGAACLLANSPELFLRRRGERVETRPIKGTRPRGDGRARDAALAAELEADAKERAEHVMIVDPERNDLGRGRSLPRRRRHRGRLGPRARARRGVAKDGRAAPRPRRGRAPRAGAVLVWLNGRFLPARDARVSALDRGLLHGDGVYDTWRTYGGVPFATAAHTRRLAAAARALGLPAPGPARLWERRVRGLLARSGLTDAAVRLTVTRGTAGEGLAPEGRAWPTLLLTARRLPAHLARRQREGVAVVLLPFPRAAGPPWGGLKLVGHASAVAGRVAASRRGAAEGLYVTAGGEVTEATSANLFLVERGALVTPPRATGILPGVTRALVIALARRAGLRVREEPVTVARLRRAREVFLTASTIEVLPVVRLDGRAVGGGRPGPGTVRLQLAYAGHVAAALRRSR